MSDWRTATDAVLVFEGWEISNDPVDKGGETCCGIDRASHGKWRGWAFVEEMRKALVKDKDILKTDRVIDAVYEYYKDRFDAIKLSEVTDQKKANQIFNLTINAGDVQGLRFVQEIVLVKIDGVMGPKTLAAVNLSPGDYFAKKLCERQKLFYNRIVAKDPSQKRFLAGWIRRAEAFA